MKILIVTHYNFESKGSGATNRVMELAKALSKYASIEILHQGSHKNLKNIKLTGYRSVFLPHAAYWILDAVSPYISYLFPDFYSTMKEAIGDADVVQVEQPYLLISTLMLTKVLNRCPLIVLDEHNVDFGAVKSKINGISLNSILTMATLPYVFLSERLAVGKAHLVLCVSQKDRELLMKFYGLSRSKLLVIPNGVDIDKFEKALPINDPLFEHNQTVFFHGTLSWYPNLEAANIIVDYLAPKMPDVTFLIAGSNPPASLIKKIDKTKNVKYLGFLNNLEGWIKSSHVCIAPILRGGGTKLKVLEYAAAGRPIVATYKAVNGLGMENGIHGLFYRDVNDNFIEGVKQVLKNDRLAKELGRNARKLAEKYNWATIGKNLYEIYSRLVG